MLVWSLGWEDPLKEGMATHASVLAWRIPWTEGSGSHRVMQSRAWLKWLSTHMSIELVMPFNHLILCCPLLLPPSVFPNIRIFSNESALHIRWLKYWSFSTCPSNEYWGLISFRIDLFDLLLSRVLSRVFPSTAIQKHQFFGAQSSLWSHFYISNFCQSRNIPYCPSNLLFQLRFIFL